MENYFPRGDVNLDLLTEVNIRPRLNFTEGTIIFYCSPNKRTVNFCFIHPIHRFLKSILSCKIWKVGYQVPDLAAVTASLRAREIVRTNTHGLVSKYEHCQK